MSNKNEPTVLDFVKALLTPWRGPIPRIPPLDENPDVEPVFAGKEELAEYTEGGEGLKPIFDYIGILGILFVGKLPWSMLVSLLFALMGQFLLEPVFRHNDSALAKIASGIVFVPEDYRYLFVPLCLYLVALLILIVSFIDQQWRLPQTTEDDVEPFSLQAKWVLLAAASPVLFMLTFLAFRLTGSDLMQANEFNPINLTVWIYTLCFIVWCLWQPGEVPFRQKLQNQLRNFFSFKSVSFKITPWGFLMAVVVVVILFFRFYQFGAVPGEMFSDHAEKLYDVMDVLDGRHSIFFPRNTGREAFQMYLTAAVSILFGTGVSFASLKLGTVLAGLGALPFIYKLGEELENRWVGLLALLFAGVAYWPNVISRVGLRFPLYPLFVAPMMYYLVRGLRRSNRNDFIFAGIALGIGLHGYSPMRIVPLLVVIAVLIYMFHQHSRAQQWRALIGMGMVALVSFAVFLPLFNYMVAEPDLFSYRAMTRLSGAERALPGPAWQIFLYNLKNACLMFFWDNGNTWVHSVLYRPALDFVTGALFFTGVVYLVYRYIARRQWSDLFLLVSVPVLMLPSILSLAFPEENPSLNRTGGAIIPVFIIVAIALYGLFNRLNEHKAGKTVAWLLGIVLIGVMLMQNYSLVFDTYKKQFDSSDWNTSQIGQVIHGFTDSVGYEETAYVIPYPYWVDTRLVGINAGFPRRDYALAYELLDETLKEPRNKLFIFNTKDEKSRTRLEQMYPNGILDLYPSGFEGKDFYIYLVPGVNK